MLGFGRTEEFQRYHLIGVMNKLMNSAEVDPIIGESGICPIEPVNSTKIKIDEASGPGALASAHGANEAVREIPWGDNYQRVHRAPHWRGKYSLDERTMTETRAIGVDGSTSPMQWMDLLLERTEAARMSIDLLMCKLVFDALRGEVEARYAESSNKTTIKYNHSPQLKMDLSAETDRDEWSTYATANPISDIQEAKNRLRRHGAFKPGLLVMGANVPEKIVQCASYINYVGQTKEAEDITRALELPHGRFLGMRPVVAEGTYPLIDRLATAYSSGTSLTLDLGANGPLSGLSAGDTIVVGMSTVSDVDDHQAEELAEVSSVRWERCHHSCRVRQRFWRRRSGGVA